MPRESCAAAKARSPICSETLSPGQSSSLVVKRSDECSNGSKSPSSSGCLRSDLQVGSCPFYLVLENPPPFLIPANYNVTDSIFHPDILNRRRICLRIYESPPSAINQNLNTLLIDWKCSSPPLWLLLSFIEGAHVLQQPSSVIRTRAGGRPH